jgi:6-phosphofructokinase
MGGTIRGNLLIAQGGGPTAVINASLFGAVRRAVESACVDAVLGARFGITGVLGESFVHLDTQPAPVLDGLLHTPGAALGSCRYRLGEDDYPRILDVCRRNDIRSFLYIGGNDSMDTAERVHRLASDQGYELSVIGVPKTVDNDLACTDRCPGYGSAARFVAQSVRDVGADVCSLRTPVCIFETMGRNAGWLAGASALARTDAESAPHRIYLPERAFEPDAFLTDVEALVARLGWAVVVVSEGLRTAAGEPVHASGDATQTDGFGHALPGDVGAYLAGLVTEALKLRCRSEKPGLCGRTSILHVSPLDREDAVCVGRAAVDAALAGHSGTMVSLLPLDADAPSSVTALVPLTDVANAERPVPADWIAESGTGVTRAFCDYVRPLIGPPLQEYVRLA